MGGRGRAEGLGAEGVSEERLHEGFRRDTTGFVRLDITGDELTQHQLVRVGGPPSLPRKSLVDTPHPLIDSVVGGLTTADCEFTKVAKERVSRMRRGPLSSIPIPRSRMGVRREESSIKKMDDLKDTSGVGRFSFNGGECAVRGLEIRASTACGNKAGEAVIGGIRFASRVESEPDKQRSQVLKKHLTFEEIGPRIEARNEVGNVKRGVASAVS